MENGHRRAKRGFSLAEVLLTVAIITVLMAVAIPGVIALRRELKMRELDDTAREIFLAVQNHLTAQKAAGTMGKGSDAGTEDPYADDCCWLSSQGGASEYLLPMGTIEGVAAGNHYLIWYNAASATVLEVYYAEDVLPESEIEAQERGYSDSYGTSHRAERREAEIGYYNGENLNRGELEQLIPPLLTIINEDDLKAVVAMPVQYENGNPAGNRVRTVLELQVTGKNADGETVTVTIDEDRYTLIREGLTERYEILLDSLTETDGDGERIAFKTLCGGIVPGVNITVTAKLTAPDSGGRGFLSASASADTNSLYADRTQPEDPAARDVVSVAWARHLQNLDAAYANDGAVLNPDGGVLYVNQTGRIEWPETVAYQSINSYGEIAGFDGNGLEIDGLWGSNGLFAWVMDAELESIRIVNPRITNHSNTDGVGALAGVAVSGSADAPLTIRDCRTYLSRQTARGDRLVEDFAQYPQYGIFGTNGYAVGGLVGYANSICVEDSFAALYHLQGSNAVGGLVGCFDKGLEDMCVCNCYATVEQLGGAPRTAAAFVGVMPSGSGVRITNCYAAANIAASSGIVSGFANGSGTISNSYCAVTYNKADGTPTGLRPQYGFAPGGSGTCAYLGGGAAPQSGESAAAKGYEELKAWGGADWRHTIANTETHPYRQELSGQGYPFPALSMPHYGSWPDLSDGMLLAYYEKYTDGTYGFFAAGVNGGRDLNTLSGTLAVEEDGYALLCGANDAETLTVTWDGRESTTTAAVPAGSLASPVSGSSAVYAYAYLLQPDNAAMALSTGTAYRMLTCSGSGFWFIPEFAKTAVNVEAPGAFPAAFTVRTARQLTCIGTASDGKWETNNESYLQERDIDFSKYGAQYENLLKFVPIGYPYQHSNGVGDPHNVGFLGTYDGGGKLITGLDIIDVMARRSEHSIGKGNGNKDRKEDYVGLFGAIAQGSTVKNVTFVSDLEKTGGSLRESRNITGGDYVGALAGRNYGTIDSCVVAGFDVSGENYVGGFVGRNKGTITNCSAGNGYFAQKKLTNGQYTAEQYPEVGGSVRHTGTGKNSVVGGFAGTNEGTVQDSYAVARMPQYRHGAEVGFVGNNKNGTLKNVYCIAIGQMDQVDVSKGIEQRDYLGLTNSGTIVNSWFLNDGDSFDSAHEKPYGALTQTFKQDAWKVEGKSGDVTTANTHHYSNAIDAQQANYPFASPVFRNGVRIHYGNWPLKELNTVFLAYYEVYPRTSGSAYEIGFYCKDLGLNTIDLEAGTIKQDGYALLFELDKRVNSDTPVSSDVKSGGVDFDKLFNQVTLTWRTFDGTPASATQRQRIITRLALDESENTRKSIYQRSAANGRGGELLSQYVNRGDLSDFYAIQVGGKSYIPTLMELNVTTSDACYDAENYYQKLTVTDTNSLTRTFWYNPHFALSDVTLEYGGNTMPDKPAAAIIRTERQFTALARTNNSYMELSADIPVVQTRDLKLGPNSDYVDSYFWKNSSQSSYLNTPVNVGTQTRPFLGVYSGSTQWTVRWDSRDKTYTALRNQFARNDSHVLSLDGWERERNGGIFGTVGKAGEDPAIVHLSDLCIQGFRSTLSGSTGNAGGLVNNLCGGTAANCRTESPIFTGKAGASVYVLGGMVGNLYGGVMTNCAVENVSITTDADSANTDCRQIGGFAGRVEGGAAEDCSVSVNTITATRYAGGFAGKVANGTLTRIAVSKSTAEGAQGMIYARKGVLGGAVGQAHVENSGQAITLSGLTARDVTVTSKTQYTADQNGTGGLIGQIYYGNVRGQITVEGRNTAERVTVRSGDVCGGLFTGNVATQDNILQQADFANAKVALVNSSLEINSNGSNAHGLLFGRISSKTTVSLPDSVQITADPSIPMLGTGEGGRIDDLGGCAGRVEKKTTLTGHLTLPLSGVTLDGGGAGNVGGFAGSLDGTVSGVTVSGAAVKNGANTGGFVGSLVSGGVSHCDVRGGSVTGSAGGAAGGFAGVTAKGVTASKCFSSAAVSDGLYLGGFVGIANGGTFRDCYASGAVHNQTNQNTASTGGFLGQSVKVLKEDNKGTEEISTFLNCFASGNVNAAVLPLGGSGITERFDGVGGFVGSSVAGDFQQCYSVGRVTVAGSTVSPGGCDEGTDLSHVGGFIGYGTPQSDASDILKQLTLFVDVIENTRVVNRVKGTQSLGILNENGLRKIRAADFDGKWYTLTEEDFGNLEDCYTFTDYVAKTAQNVDSGAFLDTTGKVGQWSKETGKYTWNEDGSLTWNVVRAMRYRAGKAVGGDLAPFYDKIQDALWCVKRDTADSVKIYWAMKSDNADLLKDYDADRDGDWRDYLYTKYGSGIVNQKLKGYYYETRNPDVVVECWHDLGIGSFGRTYVTIIGKGSEIRRISLSPTRILPAFYLYGPDWNSFDSYNDAGATAETQALYPYADQYRFIWLERWNTADFTASWAKSLPDMKLVTDGFGYGYPVPAGVGNVEDKSRYYYYGS